MSYGEAGFGNDGVYGTGDTLPNAHSMGFIFSSLSLYTVRDGLQHTVYLWLILLSIVKLTTCTLRARYNHHTGVVV